MTKTAQLAVSRGRAEAVAGTGVTVNAVLPGPTRSEILGNYMAKPASEDRPIDAPVWNMDRKIETAKQSVNYTTAYSIVLDIALDMLAKGIPVGEESLLAAATEHLGLQQTAHGDVLY